MPQQQGIAVEANGNEAMNRARELQGDEYVLSRAAPRFLYTAGARPLAGYTIKQGVGQGGFGEIYQATSDAGKEVALKLIRRNLDVELRGIRQCLNLKHPHLLNLFDIRQDDQGDTWVVMEYVAGECLEGLLATRPNGLAPAEALAWIHGIGSGVAYLHDHGIVHRDLKPGNIFRDEGLVKVGDYGLSKYISCSRRSGHTESIGTVHYMAPEVANGRYGKEIDVYAMGVILYELLTGRVPFEGESVGEVLMKHLTSRPDVSIVAEPYRSVVARALEKDPQLRYRSAAEMLAALPPATGSVFGAGTGPFFGERARLAKKPSAENMDLSPSAAERGQSHFRGNESLVGANERSAAKIGTVPSGQTARGRDDEPILRAVRDGLASLRRSFAGVRRSLDEAKLSGRMKVLLLLLGTFVAIRVAPYLVAIIAILAVFSGPLLILYGIYRLVRWLVIGGATSSGQETQLNAPAGMSAAPPAGSSSVRAAQPGRWWKRERVVPAMVVKSPRQQITELLGSLLMSSLVAAAMCLMMTLLYNYDRGTPRPELVAWLLLTSVAGAWAVLIPSKLWEGTYGETSFRRFVTMVAGLVVGATACIVADSFMVDLPRMISFSHPTHFQPKMPGFYATDGRPLMMAYAACFGTLFLVIRWWRQANPLRTTRLSLWSLAVCVVVAGVVAEVWQFPQPWLPMAAGAIATSIQVASPWVNPNERARREGP